MGNVDRGAPPPRRRPIRRRRRRSGRGLVLVVALAVTGGLYSVLAPTAQVSADVTTSQLVKEGRLLFAVGCASCHGLHAEGTRFGPVLVGVGGAAVDFQVSTGRMPMASGEGQALRKPPPSTARSRQRPWPPTSPPSVPDPRSRPPSSTTPTASTQPRWPAAVNFFRTNCAGCHSAAGAGGALPHGIYAPPLYGVENKYLYEAMTTGPAQMPSFSDDVLEPARKREIIGYLSALQERPAPGGPPLGNLGPVSEGLWAWVIGMGAMVTAAVWIAAKTARAASGGRQTEEQDTRRRRRGRH